MQNNNQNTDRHLEVGKYYNAEITEVRFKHKEGGRSLTEDEYSSEIHHIYSANESNEALLANYIDDLHHERANLSLDEIKSRLDSSTRLVIKIERGKQECIENARVFKSQYEKDVTKYTIPFRVDAITVYDEENIDEPEREFQSDKDYRKNGVIDSNYEMEHSLSHCGIDESLAVNNFTEITDEIEIAKAKESIDEFLQYESDMEDAAEAQYC